MKKTILISILALGSICASAQNMYDGLLYSKYDYMGTARTMAMGNAVTALGGDLGSININPAGSAVASYSQFTITPGLNISVSNAQGTVLQGESTPFCFGQKERATYTRMAMPNIGLTCNYDLHRKSGLKSVTIGFVSNCTGNFLDQTYARGEHYGTSIAGAMAAKASGYDYRELQDVTSYLDYPVDAWDAILGWKSGMISTLGDKFDEYVGATETYTQKADGSYDIQAAGKLDQKFGRMIGGNRSDYVFNVGFNVSDKLYLGANLGIVSTNYTYETFLKESPVNQKDFETVFKEDGGREVTTYFDNLRHHYVLSTEGTGVYGKFGFIYLPNDFIRIGGAIQTPTSNDMSEVCWSEAETHFTNSAYDGSDYTDDDIWEYKLISPFRFNLGAAVNFGMGLVSFDYEMCDYRSMKFRTYDSAYWDIYEDANTEIRDWTGAEHNLRVGLEIKPVASVAFRAGYNLLTSGERYENEFGSKIAPKSVDQSFAIGAGYSSKGSFFADFALRTLLRQDEYIYPYEDYIFDNAGNIACFTPEILNHRALWTAALTLGFRF